MGGNSYTCDSPLLTFLAMGDQTAEAVCLKLVALLVTGAAIFNTITGVNRGFSLALKQLLPLSLMIRICNGDLPKLVFSIVILIPCYRYPSPISLNLQSCKEPVCFFRGRPSSPVSGCSEPCPLRASIRPASCSINTIKS